MVFQGLSGQSESKNVQAPSSKSRLTFSAHLKSANIFMIAMSYLYAMNSIALFLVSPAALVFTFKPPTFDIKRLISASLAAVPAVTRAICCPAFSQACVVKIFFVTVSLC